MLGISKEFIYEVEMLVKINKLSHRQMVWVIIPKDQKYDCWGDELYPDNIYELLLREKDELNPYKDFNYFYLDSNEYVNMEMNKYFEVKQDYFIENFPEYDAENEDGDDPEISMQQKRLLWYKATAIVKKDIAREITRTIRTVYKTDKDVTVYVGNNVMFKAESEVDEDVNNIKELTDEIQYHILSARYDDLYSRDYIAAYKNITEQGKNSNGRLYDIARLGEIYKNM